jgi:hypothetical protein
VRIDLRRIGFALLRLGVDLRHCTPKLLD